MTGSALPSVDVVIPVLNGLPYVVQAVESALAQVGVRTRVIVVDDGSSDGTPDALAQIRSDRLVLVSGHAHESTCASRNRGVRLANSDWLTFLDADDWWPPQRTKRLLEAIRDPSTDIALGHVQPFEGDVRPEPPDATHVTGLPVAACIGGTLSARVLYDRVGSFDETLMVAEYVDWLARARALGAREIVIPEVTLLRRAHSGNTSTTREEHYRNDVLSVISKHRDSTRTR